MVVPDPLTIARAGWVPMSPIDVMLLLDRPSSPPCMRAMAATMMARPIHDCGAASDRAASAR